MVGGHGGWEQSRIHGLRMDDMALPLLLTGNCWSIFFINQISFC
jgi:hypothetical protein